MLKVDQLRIVITEFNMSFHGGAKYLKLSGPKQDMVSTQSLRPRSQLAVWDRTLTGLRHSPQVGRIRGDLFEITQSASPDRITTAKDIIIEAGGGAT